MSRCLNTAEELRARIERAGFSLALALTTPPTAGEQAARYALAAARVEQLGRGEK